MIDTHSHIYLEDFAVDLEEMLQRAKAEGVNKIYLPNIDSRSIADLKSLAKREELCVPMMGLHPGSVTENGEEELEIIINEIDRHPGYYKAIGEIGIDLYWDQTFIDKQKKIFGLQIEKAKELKLPIVIHCRDAFDEIFEVLEKHSDERLFGIFHCFTGNLEQAEKAIGFNMKLGIGGVITFKNAGLDKVIEHIDLRHIVLETDAPYLTPVPHRGKRNEPSYLKYIAQKIADIKQTTLEKVIDITTRNALEVFER